MFVLLHSQQFQLEMEQVSWKLKRNGVFFFSPLVLGKALRRGATPSHQVFLGRPYGGWSCEGPYERSFFVWAASLGKILTTDNLIKQGMVMVSSHAACARTVRVQVIFQCTVLFHHAFLGLSRGREIKEYSQYKLSVVKIKSKFFCSLFSCLLVDTVQPIIL